MIKLIALDMDGTLLNHEKRVTDKNASAIQAAKEAGITVVLASGRPREGLQPYLEQLGLTSQNDFVVSYNGSLVQRVFDDEVIYKTILKGSDVKEMFKVSLQLGVYIHAFSAKQGLITHENNTWTDLEAELNGITSSQIDFNLLDDDEDIIKVMMVAQQEDLTAAITNLPKHLKDQYTIVRSAPFFLELLHPQCDKGIAVEKLCQLLDISAEEVMCVGDAENDHAMLKFAGLSVVMENADSETKKLAHFITKSNIQDGVAFAIQEKALKS